MNIKKKYERKQKSNERERGMKRREWRGKRKTITYEEREQDAKKTRGKRGRKSRRKKRNWIIKRRRRKMK